MFKCEQFGPISLIPSYVDSSGPHFHNPNRFSSSEGQKWPRVKLGSLIRHGSFGNYESFQTIDLPKCRKGVFGQSFFQFSD